MKILSCVNMYLIIENQQQQKQFEDFFIKYKGSIPNPKTNPICLKIEEKN